MTNVAAETRARMVKAATFLAFLVAADIWLTHHYGWSLKQLAAVGGVAALVSSVLPYLKSLLSPTNQGLIAKGAQGLGKVFLWTPLLVFLWVTLAVAALTLSSITVMSDAADPVAAVSVTFPDQSGPAKTAAMDQGKVVRFHVFTTPLGRPIRVSAPGFVTTAFTLYPLTGLSVALGRDVPVAPSLLFRPEHKGLVALKNRGSFRAWNDDPSGPGVVIAETSGVMTSFLVGQPHAIPSAMLDDWRAELACDTADVRNRMLLFWKRPTLLRPQVASPGPGTRVRAEIRARSGELVALTDLVLGAGRLIDVPVLDVTPDPGACQ